MQDDVSEKSLFSTTSKIEAWLEVEVALAQSQADLGMIPREAAEEIARKGRLECIDRDALLKDIDATRAPIVSLVRFLANACDGNAGEYVHWGATTQNIMQTAEILLVRRAHRRVLERVAQCLEALADLAESGAGAVMAGRTQRRHALPITFGFKAATWIDEFLRHEERFHSAEPRVFALIFGGAVGAMHSFGSEGDALSARLAERLGLSCFDVPSRSVNDHMIEYVLLLGLLGTTCGKISQELYTLMSEEIAEVREGLGESVVGSSTMPQKVNPKLSVAVIALAAQLRAQVHLAMDAGQPSHEGDAASSRMLYTAMDTACPVAIEMLSELADLLKGLELSPDRMRANLRLTGGMINCERVMMTLARKGLGRQSAHDLVHESAIEAVRSQRDVSTVLADHPGVTAYLSKAELQFILTPDSYLGQSRELATRLAERGRTEAGLIQQRLNTGRC